MDKQRGCIHTQGVRYVYQDRDFGVIGMPENTDCWPTHYRRRGEKLMNAHFSEGDEIVRAEEVVEGERTLKVEGSNSAEVSPQIGKSVFNVLELGHSASRSEAETVKVRECRVIYRRSGVAKPRGYAEAGTLTPISYLDPNAAERKKATEAPNEKAKPEGEHKTDIKSSRPLEKRDDLDRDSVTSANRSGIGKRLDRLLVHGPSHITAGSFFYFVDRLDTGRRRQSRCRARLGRELGPLIECRRHRGRGDA